MNNDDLCKAMSTPELNKSHVIQGVAQAFGMALHGEAPKPKNKPSTFEQQRRINQAKERREKRNLKRAKHAIRNSQMG